MGVRAKTLLLSLFAVLCAISYTTGHVQFCSSCSKITVGKWLNLLRYAKKALSPEPATDHQEHFNTTDHVQLIANSIIKHFYNDIFTPNFTEDGQFRLLRERSAVDFLMMLDSSASIGSENFQHALHVLKSWVDVLPEEDFSSDKLRLSMISFSEPDKVRHEFPFSSRQDKSDLLDMITSTSYHNGSSTSTALGLRLAERVFKTTSNRNATRVLLLATDGWSNDNSIPFGVLWPAAKLKVGLGVQVFVLGIGDQVNHNELVAIGSSPSEYHLFEVADYDMMSQVMEEVKRLNEEQERRYQDLST